jgi:hypothetical protein
MSSTSASSGTATRDSGPLDELAGGLQRRPRTPAIIGTGGHGREMLDIVTAINSIAPTWTFVGFLDDVRPDPSLLPQRAATWLGPVSALADMDVRYVVGIGDSTARAEVDRLASGWGRGPDAR